MKKVMTKPTKRPGSKMASKSKNPGGAKWYGRAVNKSGLKG